MDIAYAPCYVLDVPEGHRFPMRKYALLREQLLHEGVALDEHFFEPRAMSQRTLLLAHEEDYWRRTQNGEWTRQEERRSGFPWSHAMVQRERVIMQGTLECAQRALKSGSVAMNIAGGTHHAFSNRAEGFCILNDFAITSLHLLKEGLAKKVLIVDCDVHQGNGTASILASEPDVFTFSMHGASNYPLHKEQSNLDVALQDGTDGASYLDSLERHLSRILDEDQWLPDLVLYQCGVDILGSDKLGRLDVSMQDCQRRDEMIFERFAQAGIPVVCAMGGGYSEDVKVVVQAHMNTFRAAVDAWT